VADDALKGKVQPSPAPGRRHSVLEVLREEKVMRFIASSVAVFVAVASAQGGLVNPLIPSWAGSVNSQVAAWESFTQAGGGANLPDQAGSAPFSLMNFAPGSFITGTGNIYSINSPLYVMIMGGTLMGAGASQGNSPLQVVMNVATAGTLISAGSVRLSLFDNAGNSMSLAPALTEIRADAPAQPQGSIRTTAYTWNTSFLPFAATGFRVEFMASAGSMALDAVRLDLNYVPAPGALALVGLAAVTARRRR
jgi:hypothetical protein